MPTDREPEPLVADLDAAADLVRAELLDPATDPVHSLATARELGRVADAALRHLVAAARERGVSWQRIGDALGTSRQAAFQRFGAPVDPRTGTVMDRTILPGAAERALAHLAAVDVHDWAGVAADFGPQVAAHLDAGGLAAAYASVIALVGERESVGEPEVRALAGVTLVEVPLHHEAGDLRGRVSYDAAGAIVGLWFLPVEDAR